MTFATPWAFLLLLILPIIIYRYFSKSVLRVRTGKIQFSSTQQASLAGASLRQRLIHLPFMLRILDEDPDDVMRRNLEMNARDSGLPWLP